MSPTSLTSVFLSNRRSLVGTVFRIVRDRQIAEDLAQEAYLRARNAIEHTAIDHLEAFLHQTARNLALDHERRRKTRQKWEEADGDDVLAQVPSSEPTAETSLIEQEQLRLLDAALQQLPVRARHVWALVQQGWTYQQIAEQLGVSRNTVYGDVKLVMGHCHDMLARLNHD